MNGSLTPRNRLVGRISGRKSMSGRMSAHGRLVGRIRIGGGIYGGAYTVTPTQATQVLVTGGKMLAGDITINPIPSNYGLITWNGSVLTVS